MKQEEGWAFIHQKERRVGGEARCPVMGDLELAASLVFLQHALLHECTVIRGTLLYITWKTPMSVTSRWHWNSCLPSEFPHKISGNTFKLQHNTSCLYQQGKAMQRLLWSSVDSKVDSDTSFFLFPFRSFPINACNCSGVSADRCTVKHSHNHKGGKNEHTLILVQLAEAHLAEKLIHTLARTHTHTQRGSVMKFTHLKCIHSQSETIQKPGLGLSHQFSLALLQKRSITRAFHHHPLHPLPVGALGQMMRKEGGGGQVFEKE